MTKIRILKVSFLCEVETDQTRYNEFLIEYEIEGQPKADVIGEYMDWPNADDIIFKIKQKNYL